MSKLLFGLQNKWELKLILIFFVINLLIIVILFDMHRNRQNAIDPIRNKFKNPLFKNNKDTNSFSLAKVTEKQLSHIRAPPLNNVKDDYGNKFRKSEPKLNKMTNHSEEMNKTLQLLNFNHHGQGSCLCNDCGCGRHLCKLSVIKPNLKKVSVYQNLFKYKKPISMVVVTSKQTSPLKANHLDLRTNYIKQYKQSGLEKLQRPKPQDELKFDGPTPNVTTYGSSFIGHRGDNQYIKPTNKHKMGEFPLLHKTVYSTEFVKKISKSICEKMDDSLKLGKSWFGSSTYNNSFCAPNPQGYVPHGKIVQKRQDNLQYSHQFETNYNNEFVQKPSPLCPSKIYLQLGNSKGLENSKHLFRQNSDFKSLSPQFKAISTSKHFYA